MVVEDISNALIVYKDLVSVVVPHLYANNEGIVLWVVEMSCIFLCESDHKFVDSCHLWDESHQLDVLNHPKVRFACLSGRTGSYVTPYNHPYVS